MSSARALPNDLVRDAIAQIDAAGVLVPVTEAMHEWLRAVSPDAGQVALDQLPLTADQRAALDEGEPVVMVVGEGLWQLRRQSSDGCDWLVAIDVDDRERRIRAGFEVARSRSLGRMAATLAHDLNNQFNAVLALSAHLDEYVQDEGDRETIRELEKGTKVGSRMASALARLLVGRGYGRQTFPASQLVDDAIALMRKSLEQAGITLEVEAEPDLPSVHGALVEAVQAVMSVLTAFEHFGAGSVHCSVSRESVAIADGRSRDCVVLRCSGGPWDAAAIAPLLAVLEARPGTLRHVASNPDILDGVANALYSQKRVGGDLTFELAGQTLALAFAWPAVR